MTEESKKRKTRFTLTLLSANPSDEEIAALVKYVKKHSTNLDQVGANEQQTKKTKVRHSHVQPDNT